MGKINEGTVVTVNGTPQTVWEASGQFVPIYDGQLVDMLYGQAAGTGQGQTHVPYGTSATASYLAQRDLNGQLNVPQTPTANGHAASKKYVDDKVADALPIEQNGDLIVGTSTAHIGTRLAIGSANQVLGVNSSGNGLEYKTINSVPAYTSSNANQKLSVNSLGTGLEWQTISSGGGSLGSLVELENTSGTTRPANILLASNRYSNNMPPVNSSTFYGNFLLGSQLKYSDAVIKSSSNELYGSLIVSPFYNSNTSGDLYCPASGSYNILFFDGNPLTSNYNSVVASRSIANVQNTENVSRSGQLTITDCVLPYAYISNNTHLSAYSSLLIYDCTYTSSRDFQCRNSIVNVAGTLTTNAYNITYFGGNSPKTAGGSILCAVSPEFVNQPTDQGNALAIFGNLPTYDNTVNSTDRLIVGAGSGTTHNNCFATGNDGTNDYIKIGDTKLTETQLTALIALLS